MGNWNRRHGPRKKYFHNYQEPPPSPPRTQPYPYGRSENGVPSWEIDFCYSGGVTWHKVLTTKQFMFCHDRVVKWNDFAGEVAFHNAKRRYWEKINGLPCDPLPNSEMYIDKIDWEKTYVDPKLMLDLDREYFNPDEGEQCGKSDTNLRKRNSWSLVHNDHSTHNGENLLESNLVDCRGRLESFVDPWEQRYTELAQSVNKNAWRGSGDGSWGWNNGQFLYAPQSPHLSWTQGFQSVGYVTMNGWGHVFYNSWSSNYWGNNHLPVNLASDDSGWGDWGSNSQGWKHSESVNGGPRYSGFLRQSRETRAP